MANKKRKTIVDFSYDLAYNISQQRKVHTSNLSLKSGVPLPNKRGALNSGVPLPINAEL